MRSNKICFWICITIVCISIVLTGIFEWASTECGKQIYTLLSNVAISLLGGAILAASTSAVSFENRRKQSIVRFCSDYIKQANIIKEIANWYNCNFNDIKYDTVRNEKIDCINNKKVHGFFELLEKITNYDYDSMNIILDDYCDLFLVNKKSKIRKQMREMASLVFSYNVLYDKQFNTNYSLYKQKQHSEYVFFDNEVRKMRGKYLKEEIEKLCEKESSFLKITKINNYLSAIHKGKNQ